MRSIIEIQFPLFISYPTNPVARYGHEKPPHPMLYDRLNAQRASFADQVSTFARYTRNILAIAEDNAPDSLELYWNNGFLPALDGIGPDHPRLC